MTSFQEYFATNKIPLSEARELLWENMLAQVTFLLKEAERRIRSPEGTLIYPQLEGWWRKARVKFTNQGPVRVPQEESISEAIVAEIEKFQEEMSLDASANGSPLDSITQLEFAVEQPRRRKRGVGKHSKPTDIRVYRRGLQILDLRIEAKMLIRDSDVGGTYLGKSGMGRFSDPFEPYTDHEIGGMLAYTVSADRKFWGEAIAAKLQAATPPFPVFSHTINASADAILFCRVPFVSSVQPALRTELLVFHLVLEFDSSPVAR